MDVIEQITSKSEFFYKRNDLPIVKVGDKVKVLNYLEEALKVWLWKDHLKAVESKAIN